MYRGVGIGKVSNISFAGPRFGMNPSVLGGDPAIHAVVIDMEISSHAMAGMSDRQFTGMIQQMVARGLRARITSAGLTGGSLVDLEYVDPNLNPPPVLPWRPDALYVPAAPSNGIGETLDAVQRIAGKLEASDLPGLISHYRTLAESATTAVDDVDGVVKTNRDNLQHTLAEVSEAATRLHDSATRVEQILHDPRVEHLLNELPKAGDSANNTLADARRLLAQANDLIAAEADDIRGVIADLRRTSANAAGLTDDLKQNPARLIFGQPPQRRAPGE
jgi:paraquat-inducible protein B